MAYTLDGREGTLGPGGSVTILPGSVHTFWMPDRDQGDSEDLDIVVTATGGGERGYGEEFGELRRRCESSGRGCAPVHGSE